MSDSLQTQIAMPPPSALPPVQEAAFHILLFLFLLWLVLDAVKNGGRR